MICMHTHTHTHTNARAHTHTHTHTHCGWLRRRAKRSVCRCTLACRCRKVREERGELAVDGGFSSVVQGVQTPLYHGFPRRLWGPDARPTCVLAREFSSWFFFPLNGSEAVSREWGWCRDCCLEADTAVGRYRCLDSTDMGSCSHWTALWLSFAPSQSASLGFPDRNKLVKWDILPLVFPLSMAPYPCLLLTYVFDCSILYSDFLV